MQTQKYEVPATEKQVNFISRLQSRRLVSDEVDFGNLTKREASIIIDAALDKAKRKALDEEQEESPAPNRKIDPIRLGLSIKLVYNKHEHGMANAKGVANFKDEVKQLYQIITDLEREF